MLVHTGWSMFVEFRSRFIGRLSEEELKGRI